MHPEGAAFSLEKNKRMLKTSFQLDALETFYNEHKYPSESMKSQFGEDVGLSLKQVSSWFCHRRLKDKKLANEICADGTQNVSSDVMHDLSSGIQESCSSTKHGDYRSSDFREIESKRFHVKSSPSAVLTSVKGQHTVIRSYTPVDNRSSGSSSASQERLLHQSDEHILTNIKQVRKRGCIVEPGYSNLQHENDNHSICAVKRRLGTHYREDGPPLAVDFQSLPPGAFDCLIKDTNESCNALNFLQQRSNSAAGANKESEVHDKFRHKQRHPHTSYAKGIGIRKAKMGFRFQHESTNYPLTSKASLSIHRDQVLGRTSVEALDFTSRNRGTSDMYSVKARSIYSHDNSTHLCDTRAMANKLPSYPHVHNDASANLFHTKDNFGAKLPHSTLRHNGSLDAQDILQHRRPRKEKKLYQRLIVTDYSNKVQPKKIAENKKKGNEIWQQDYMVTIPSTMEFPWRKPAKGYTAELPTSEDETGGSTSSVD